MKQSSLVWILAVMTLLAGCGGQGAAEGDASPQAASQAAEPPAQDEADTLRSAIPAQTEYVVVHDHVLFSSHVDPSALAALAPRLRLLAEFDPFRRDRDGAVFEELDAYYIPMHGFDAVVRPGPRIRIYRFE